jgi:hypothetical protein
MTMKNFIETALENSPKNSLNNSVENQRLKGGIEGEGAVYRGGLRNKSGECWFSQCFSAKFLQLIRSSPFGFTLVELLVVIGDYRRVNRSSVASGSSREGSGKTNDMYQPPETVYDRGS